MRSFRQKLVCNSQPPLPPPLPAVEVGDHPHSKAFLMAIAHADADTRRALRQPEESLTSFSRTPIKVPTMHRVSLIVFDGTELAFPIGEAALVTHVLQRAGALLDIPHELLALGPCIGPVPEGSLSVGGGNRGAVLSPSEEGDEFIRLML